MSARAGWYPDPGGQPGLFRYWDGKAWSATTTTNPYVAPPSGLQGGGGVSSGDAQQTLLVAPKRRSPVGWILAAVALGVVAAVVVGVVLIVRSRDVAEPPAPDPGVSTSGSPAVVCPPTPPSQTPTLTPDRGGDRVTSGHLSYPRLDYPFGPPFSDPRTPFGRDVQSQAAVVEKLPDGKSGWVAAVLIARLLAGDGFYGPQQGAAVVAECVVGKFYGDNPVQRKDVRNEATKVDGHDAWMIEMHLTFDIPNLKTKGETATIVVVDTGAADGEAGLFYSSIPDTSPQFTQPAADALKSLQVS